MIEQEIQEVFKGKHILVTGGTESFGQQIVKDLLRFDPAIINIYSRDQKKQLDMAMSYRKFKNLRFNIGDVRNLERTRDAMREIRDGV